ncbi:MAG: type 4a pilus biogenesis protein PilO [Pseudomonadota bacterium]
MNFGLREILFTVCLMALPVAVYFYVFQPRTVKTEQARIETMQMQAKLDQLEEATANMPDLGAEIEKLAEAIAIYEERLPQREEVEGILEDVWRVAVRNRLEPMSVRTQQTIGTAAYSELPIRMKIKGDFDGFYQFLLDVEKLPRITRMPDLRLNKSKESEDAEGLMVAELTLSIFFEGDQPQSSRNAGGAI